MKFGPYIRQKREAKALQGTRLSLRAFARQLDIEPSYLSKIERAEFPPPSEELIVKIAQGLGEDPDMLLALAGKIASDVKEAIIASGGSLAKVIRDPSRLAEQPRTFSGSSQKAVGRLRKRDSQAQKDSYRVRRWNIRDMNDEESALPHGVILDLQKKYGFDNAILEQLWTEVESAMLPDIVVEPKGETKRSKAEAAKILAYVEAQVSTATPLLASAREWLAEITFIDPVLQAAEDNPYWRFVQRLEALGTEIEDFEQDLIDLPKTGVEPVLNELANLTHLEDVRRERISWAVFSALVSTGYELNWTWPPHTEMRENEAVTLVNELAQHLMDPFQAFGGDTLFTDWQAWNSKPKGRNTPKRGRRTAPKQ